MIQPTPAPLVGLPFPTEPVCGGYLLHRLDAETEVLVLLQSHGVRIVQHRTGWPLATWERFWCYRGPNALLAAISAAHVWTDPAGEPVGWRSSWDGRTNF